jgi:eukaryotic-like serine/threonine-protein kinase
MNEPSALLQGLSEEAVGRLEEACCRFEDAWLAGRRPRLEDFVCGPDGDERLALLRELLRLEVYYRRRAGEGPSAADYQTRFPEATAVLQEVFASPAGPDRAPPPVPAAGDPERTGPELLPPTTDEGHAAGNGDVLVPGDPGDARPSRYRVLRFHAAGNMGEVFLAEDTELHRDVALKEIKPERAQRQEYRSRFVLEAEVTGRLEHPGVVPVYGLGAYADGRPYYAMRFIQGDKLAVAIAQFHARPPLRFDSLEFRGLLGRFVAVCQAVAYAHSRGVLHRDLKPGNIMLGKFGETLVVDWGLAKVAGRPGGNGAVPDEEERLRPRGDGWAATAAGAVVGTPAFMSPEQARGEGDELGPATDVYGLGATLYALLTNQAPFRGKVTEVLPQVQRGEWLPARQVNAAVPAALDAICRKAMALRPEERYGSALELAGEVEHWLADEPVAAYREPAGARLRRWMRKHPRRVTGAAVLLLAAVAGLTMGMLLLNHANQAIQESYIIVSEKQDFFLREVGDNYLLDEPNMEPLQQALLAEALESFEELLKKAPNDRQIRQRLAEAYRQNAELNGRLGRMREAISNAQRAVNQLEDLLPDQPGDEKLRFGLARCYRALADVQIHSGHHQEGQQAADRGLTLVDQSIGVIREETADHRLLKGRLHDLRATARYHQGHLDDALADSRQAVDALFVAYEINITGTLNNYINQLPADYPGQSRKVHKKTTGALYVNFFHREGRMIEEALTRAAFNRAQLLERVGRPDEAATLLQAVTLAFRNDAVRLQRRRNLLASALLAAGQVETEQGQPARATAELREALDLFRALRQEEALVAEYRTGPARAAGCLGETLLARGQTAPAAVLLREAVQAAEANAPEPLLLPAGTAPAPPRRAPESELSRIDPTLPAEQARFFSALGRLEAESGRLAEGMNRCLQALERQEQLLARAPGDLALRRALLGTREALVRFQLCAGRLSRDDALAQQQKLLEARQDLARQGKQAPALQREAVASAANLADYLHEAGREDRALQVVEEVLPSQEALVRAGQVPWSKRVNGDDLRHVASPLTELRQRNVLDPGIPGMSHLPEEAGTYPGPQVFGHVLHDQNKRAEFVEQWIPWAALERRQAVPPAADLRLLARLLGLRAAALAATGQAESAREALDRALLLTEDLVRGNGNFPVPPWSWSSAWSAVAQQLVPQQDPEPCHLYDRACYLALASTLPGNDRIGDRGGQAVQALRTYASAGFDNAYQLRTDPRLAPLRGREDFRKLVQDLESRAQPQPANAGDH